MGILWFLRRRTMVVVAVAVLLPFASIYPAGAADWASSRRVARGTLEATTVDDTGRLHLVVRRRDGSGLDYVTNRSGSWRVTHIPSSRRDSSSAIALVGGRVFVVSERGENCDCVPSGSTGLVLATNASGTWRLSRLTNDGGSSVALRVAGGKLHMAYVRHGGIAYWVRSPSGSWTTRQVVSAGSDPIDQLVSHIGVDLAIDSKGKVHIAYDRADEGASRPGVFYVTNKSGSWVRRRVTSSDLDWLDRILIDPSGRPVIGYSHESGDGRFRVARLLSGAWAIATAPGAGSGSFTLDSKGRAHVVIWDYDSDGLRYDQPTSSGWKPPTTIDAKGSDAHIRTTGACGWSISGARASTSGSVEVRCASCARGECRGPPRRGS